MTEKRFRLHIEWYDQEKIDGEATLHDMGQPLGVIESIEDARLIRDTLNDLFDENKQLKQDVKCHEERIAILSQLLDLADALIDLCDDESSKKFWEKMNDNMASKWEELQNKKVKRDYTSRGIYDE